MKKNNLFTFIFISLGLIIILAILLPIINIFLNIDSKILSETIIDKDVISSIIVTVRAAFYASIAGMLFGVPLAYILARYK